MSPLNVNAIVFPSGEIAGYRIQLAPWGEVEGDCATAAAANVASATAERRRHFICKGGIRGNARRVPKSVKRGNARREIARLRRADRRREQIHTCSNGNAPNGTRDTHTAWCETL